MTGRVGLGPKKTNPWPTLMWPCSVSVMVLDSRLKVT